MVNKSLLTSIAFIALIYSASAQLSVRNDAYIYAKNQVLFVKDNVNLKEPNSKIYLRDEAQLIQGDGTTGNSGLGELSVYQDGNVNQWSYNYWCSPVGGILIDDFGNNEFRINQTDDPLLSTASTIDSQNSLFTGAFEGIANPLTISNRWLWTFVASDSYSDWVYAGNSGDISPGLGFTMKGIGSGTTGSQTYDFRGKPNNGTIGNTVLEDNYTLVGNPYPSALDAALYIHDTDNFSAINGTLYFWEQDGTVNSHVLSEYVGGYYEFSIDPTGTTITETPAVFKTYDENDNTYPLTTSQNGGKFSGRYIPIGQGFMVKGATGTTGTVYTKNSHRVYEKEGAESLFFRSTDATNNIQNPTVQYQNNGLSVVPENFKRFRINVDFNVNNSQYTRQVVLNFNDAATLGFDYGLELIRSESHNSDAYFMYEDKILSGQAYPFDETLRIPLVVDIEEQQPLRFRIFDIQNFEETQAIYIHDTETDTYVNLREQDYELNILPGNYTNRFEIVFAPQDVLDVEDLDVSSLTIFQNNNNRQLTILNPENLDINAVEIFDVSGKLILKKALNSIQKQYDLPTANYSNGVYIVNITSKDNSSKSQKVIIKN